MVDGNKYSNNLYATTDLKKTRGSIKTSKIEKIVKILLK